MLFDLNASQTTSALPSEFFSMFTFAIFLTNSKQSSNVHSEIRLAIENRLGGELKSILKSSRCYLAAGRGGEMKTEYR